MLMEFSTNFSSGAVSSRCVNRTPGTRKNCPRNWAAMQGKVRNRRPVNVSDGDPSPLSQNLIGLFGRWQISECCEQCHVDGTGAGADVDGRLVPCSTQSRHQSRQRARFVAATRTGARDDDRYPLAVDAHQLARPVIGCRCIGLSPSCIGQGPRPCDARLSCWPTIALRLATSTWPSTA